MARVRAVVHGRVQGVSYRMSTLRAAIRRGLSGWVANQRDGTVLFEAQGERALVEELLAWARRGPSGARVHAVHVDWIEEVAAEVDFEIRH